jgi:hypothetical protein
MTRKELIEKLMNVAENYKEGYLYGTGALTEIGVLVDDYTETVVKNCSIPNAVGSTSKCFLINNSNKMEDVSDDLWRCVKCKREIHIMNRLGKDNLCH